MNNLEDDNSKFAKLSINQPKEEVKKVPKKALFREKHFSVYKPVFAKKIHKLAGNQLPKTSLFSSFASHLKTSIVGMTEQEADQLMRIDEGHSELSNQDVILAKPGCIIKKCWRLKNLGTRQWPKDTRIVSVTDDLLHVAPKITDYLKAGEMMDIGINIYIPKSENGENNIKEYIMRLYCQELK